MQNSRVEDLPLSKQIAYAVGQFGWSTIVNILGVQLQYAGRDELCQPAVGVGQVHQQENRHIIDQTFL